MCVCVCVYLTLKYVPMHRLNITKKLPTKRKGLVAIANSGGGEGGVRISPKL